MAGRLTLRIFTPDDFREEAADAVLLPSAGGPMEVLPSHAPLTAALEGGEVLWREGSRQESFAIRGGAVSIAQNIVTVCVEKA
jgi:F0F1-type ATP synthase epsilon subunit